MKKRFLGFITVIVMLLLFACTTSKVTKNVETGVDEKTIVSEISDNIVTVSSGQIKGSVEDSVYRFLGVPYAEASEYFKEAKDAHWDGVLDATKYGSISIQSAMFGGVASEPSTDESNNCQNLNTWTNGLDNKNRAVMVWLHGGGFSSGTANSDEFDGKNLAKNQDVVVVGVNHRLGTFGHLNLSAYGDDYKYSANIGIDDIVKSLIWIKNNISKFGGNPNNVTLFGESGGGAKVLAMMTTEKAKGLFNKGIVESGATETMGVKFAELKPSLALGDRTLQKLGIDKDNIEEIQKKSIVEINKAASEVQQEIAEEYKIPVSIGNGYSYVWEPVTDGDFLPTDPVTETGFAKAGGGVALLIGSNLNEWSTTMTDLLAFKNMTDEEKEEYKKAYPNESEDTAMYVDTLIRKPMLKIMSHKAAEGKGDVYAYVFTKQVGERGSYHTAEIPFVFDNVDDKLADTMSEAWANFAKIGVPKANGLETWEKYDKENMATMILDDKSYLAKNHDRKLMSLLEPDYKYWP